MAPIKMDLDDTLLHYILWFGGMICYAVIKKLADILGLDILKFFKKSSKKKV